MAVDGDDAVPGGDAAAVEPAPLLPPPAAAPPVSEKDKEKWDELTAPGQAAATTLGFDEARWESGERPPTTRLWAALTEDEAEAARVLGYTEEGWDAVAFTHGCPEAEAAGVDESESEAEGEWWGESGDEEGDGESDDEEEGEEANSEDDALGEDDAEAQAEAEAEAAEGATERAIDAERAMEVDAEPPSPQQRLQERVKTIFAELQAAGSPPNEAARRRSRGRRASCRTRWAAGSSRLPEGVGARCT